MRTAFWGRGKRKNRLWDLGPHLSQKSVFGFDTTLQKLSFQDACLRVPLVRKALTNSNEIPRVKHTARDYNGSEGCL